MKSSVREIKNELPEDVLLSASISENPERKNHYR